MVTEKPIVKPGVALAADTWTALSRPLDRLVGARSAKALAKLGLETVEDLLNHVPFRVARRGELLPIESVREGDSVTVVARVMDSSSRPMNNRAGFILNVTISDGAHDLDLTFLRSISVRLRIMRTRCVRGRLLRFLARFRSIVAGCS